MTRAATIGGELVALGSFSAFKAVEAMRIVESIEDSVRQLVTEAEQFRAEYRSTHAIRVPRAAARREFAPSLLLRQVEGEDGRVVVEPVVGDDGQPLVGPDPLGHLTDADWAASGEVLEIPKEPSENDVIAAMVPRGFRIAQTAVLRILALVLASNGDLERWDQDGQVDERLDEEGKRLLHRASAAELIGLAVATIEVIREEVAGPFASARAELSKLLATTDPAPDAEPAAEPMQFERSEDSSTSSPGDTDGRPMSSSTVSAGTSS